jgi:hypothetical protein
MTSFTQKCSKNDIFYRNEQNNSSAVCHLQTWRVDPHRSWPHFQLLSRSTQPVPTDRDRTGVKTPQPQVRITLAAAVLRPEPFRISLPAAVAAVTRDRDSRTSHAGARAPRGLAPPRRCCRRGAGAEASLPPAAPPPRRRLPRQGPAPSPPPTPTSTSLWMFFFSFISMSPTHRSSAWRRSLCRRLLGVSGGLRPCFHFPLSRAKPFSGFAIVLVGISMGYVDSSRNTTTCLRMAGI